MDNLELGVVLGEGAWGSVRVAKHKYTEKYYAVKIMSKYGLIKEKQADHAKNELEIFRSLDHPFIVNYRSFEQDSRCIYMVQDFVRGGEFYTLLKQKQRLDVDATRFFAAQLVIFFGYLHSNKIVYRDLKPENILVDKTGYLKVIDFGLSKKIYKKTYTICGTPHYIAPEILKQEGYSFETDWYTLGVVLYEILTGLLPFNGETHNDLFNNITNGKLRFPLNFDKDAKRLIIGLMKKDPTERYGLSKIMGSKFFKDVDFDKIKNRNLEPPYFPSVKKDGDTSNFKDIKVSMLNSEN